MTPPRRKALWLLAAAGGAIAAVNGLDAPLTVRRFRAVAGGALLLDLRLGYTPEEAGLLLARLGAAGRSSYLTMLWTVDLLLPALFALALGSALAAGRFGRWRWLALAAAGVDYLENGALSALLLAFPGQPPLLARLASALTIAKFALYALAAACALAGLWTASKDPRDHRREPGGTAT